LTSTGTRYPGPNLERSRIFSEFARCATVIGGVAGTSHAILLIRHGRIIARTPRPSWP
jgi:hypothetical protein